MLIGLPVGGPSAFLSTVTVTPGYCPSSARRSSIIAVVLCPSRYLKSTKFTVIRALLGVSDMPMLDGSLGSPVPCPTLPITDSTIDSYGFTKAITWFSIFAVNSFVTSMSVPVGNSINTLIYLGSFTGKKITLGGKAASNTTERISVRTVPPKTKPGFDPRRVNAIILEYLLSILGNTTV